MSHEKVVIREGIRHPSRKNREVPIGSVCRDVKFRAERLMMPRNKDTAVGFRISQDWVDWLYTVYPEDSLAVAIRKVLKEQYELFTRKTIR